MSKLPKPTPAQTARAVKYKLLGETSCESCQFFYGEARDIEVPSKTAERYQWRVSYKDYYVHCALDQNPQLIRDYHPLTYAFDRQGNKHPNITDAMKQRCVHYLERAAPLPTLSEFDRASGVFDLTAKAERAIERHRKKRRNRFRAADERRADRQDGEVETAGP